MQYKDGNIGQQTHTYPYTNSVNELHINGKGMYILYIYGINEMQNTSLKGLHLEVLVPSPCQHHPVRGKRGILLNEVGQGLLM